MKTKTKIAVACLALTLAACSNSEIADTAEIVQPGPQTIVIKVSDARSRAGRELTSQKPDQSVENVLVFITNDQDTVKWVKLLDAWNSTNPATVQSDSTKSGREAEIEVPKDDFRMLHGDKYHIYAYAYSNSSDYDLSPITGIVKGSVLTSDVAISLKTGVAAEEIFAGDCSVEGNMAGVRANLVLNRQVAGTFAYLTCIPYVKDAQGHKGRYLMLTASNPQKTMVLGSFDNADASAAYNGRYVVNSHTDAESKVIYTIDLLDWFKDLVPAKEADGRSTGLIEVLNGNWLGDVTRYKRGSVFAGRFLLPFAKTDAATLQLKLCYEKSLDTAMRTWNVTLPADAAQLSEYDITQWLGGSWADSKVQDTNVVYNILRNHLYAIGTKLTDKLPVADPNDPNGPVDPSDPDVDTPGDVPEPINNKQELTIIVNNNWDAIYNMGVE